MNEGEIRMQLKQMTIDLTKEQSDHKTVKSKYFDAKEEIKKL